MRRYNRWHARFDQPDPYNLGHDLAERSVRLNPSDQYSHAQPGLLLSFLLLGGGNHRP